MGILKYKIIAIIIALGLIGGFFYIHHLQNENTSLLIDNVKKEQQISKLQMDNALLTKENEVKKNSIKALQDEYAQQQVNKDMSDSDFKQLYDAVVDELIACKKNSKNNNIDRKQKINKKDKKSPDSEGQINEKLSNLRNNIYDRYR